MLEEKQKIFYKMTAQELTNAQEKISMRVYDLAKLSGEQWNTVKKMLNGGKFMAHHFLWLRLMGVDLNTLMDNIQLEVAEIPEEVKEAHEHKEKYRSQIEEPEIDDEDSEEGIESLF